MIGWVRCSPIVTKIVRLIKNPNCQKHLYVRPVTTLWHLASAAVWCADLKWEVDQAGDMSFAQSHLSTSDVFLERVISPFLLRS